MEDTSPAFFFVLLLLEHDELDGILFCIFLDVLFFSRLSKVSFLVFISVVLQDGVFCPLLLSVIFFVFDVAFPFDIFCGIQDSPSLSESVNSRS